MKLIYLISCLLLLSYAGYAQNIGINDDGSTPDSKAILDIKITDFTAGGKGLLIPRMTYANRPSGVGASQDGMLAYFTDGEGTNGKGYYYYDHSSTSWKKFFGGADNAYILNQTTQQASSNFNISGAGVIGTNLSVNGEINGPGISGGSNGSLNINSNNSIKLYLDANGGGSESFDIFNGTPSNVFSVTEGGNVSADGNGTFNGNLTLSGDGRVLSTGTGFDIRGNSGIDLNLDYDNNGSGSEFHIKANAAGNSLFSVSEDTYPIVFPHGTLTGNTGGITFRELVANGTSYTGFKAPDALGANYLYTLPSTNGSADQVMKTDGSGNLSWTDLSDVNAWKITGNSGTTAGTNFIGTTDAQDFVIKTGGSAAGNERMRILSTGSNVGIGVTPTTGYRLYVQATGSSYDGIYGEHTSTAAGSAYNAVKGSVVQPVSATGYLGYHTSSDKSYGVYGTGGTLAGFFDNHLGIGNAKEIRFYEATGSGSNYSAFKAQAQAGDVTYTLPAADATVSGSLLSSNSSGTLSWTDPATLGVRWNSIIAPNGNASIAHATYTTAFSFDGVTAGSAFTMSSSGITTGKLLDLSNTAALTSGSVLSLAGNNTTAANFTGNVLYATTAGTAPANGYVRFNFTGAHSGNGLQIDDATATGNVIDITANSLTSGSAIDIATSSSITGSILKVTASNASFTGNGIKSDMQGTTGATYAIWGQTASSAGFAMYANATSTSGTNYGISAKTASNDGYSVKAVNTSAIAASTASYGDRIAAIYAKTSAANTIGVFAEASAAAAQAIGVWGAGSGNAASIGVMGIGNAVGYSALAAGAGGYFIGDIYGSYSKASGTGATSYGSFSTASGATTNIGAIGAVAGINDDGVWGVNLAATNSGSGVGVYGYSLQTGGAGVYGDGDLYTDGLYGYSNNASYSGLNSVNYAANGNAIYTRNWAAAGAGTGTAINARCDQTGGNAVRARLSSTSYYSGAAVSADVVSTVSGGVGVIGNCDNATGVGVVGQSSGSTAVGVSGNVSNASAHGIEGVNSAASGAGSGIGIYGASSQSGGAGIYGVNNTTSNGTSYFGGAIGGIWGDKVGTGTYQFGVVGKHQTTAIRSGGVLGTYNTTNWASLGYMSSGSVSYGIYYYSATSGSGTGFMPSGNIQTGIGMGGVGGVMGGWSRGEVLGFTSMGELYASYNLGNEYTSGHQVEIVNVNNVRLPAYTNTSTEIKIYEDGTSQLNAGKCHVSFPKAFATLLSKDIPATVTVTPLGKCSGIYIESIDENGFTVVEQNNGNSDVKFSWITIGRRYDFKDVENLPNAITSPDFDENLKEVMFNETNTSKSAKPIWWDGTKLRFDEIPVFSKDKEVVTPSLYNNSSKVKIEEAEENSKKKVKKILKEDSNE